MSQEIGNAWLPQMGTDPFRLRAIREISRLRNAWLEGGRISAEDQGLHEYQSRLLIPVNGRRLLANHVSRWAASLTRTGLRVQIEHNFGMSVRKVLNATAHTTCWTNGCFHPLMRTGGRSSTGCATFDGHCTGYDGLEEFARERDSFLWPLPARDGKGSPQYAAFAAEVGCLPLIAWQWLTSTLQTALMT